MYMCVCVYWFGTGKISNFLSSLLREVLGCAPTIILMIFFCKVNIFLLLDELPQKIIPYFTIEWGYHLELEAENQQKEKLLWFFVVCHFEIESCVFCIHTQMETATYAKTQYIIWRVSKNMP